MKQETEDGHQGTEINSVRLEYRTEQGIKPEAVKLSRDPIGSFKEFGHFLLCPRRSRWRVLSKEVI